MRMFGKVPLALAVAFQFCSIQGSGAVAGPLKAGAARVDITPDAHAIPRPFTSILDSLYVRAIYLENGQGPRRSVECGRGRNLQCHRGQGLC